jgi:sulfate permease, SulP family
LSLITVVALTPIFKDLPKAVLAALIIHAVSHLMKVAEMRRYYRLKRREFWLAMATLTAVITLDVLPALIIGVVFSLVVLICRASRPRLSRLGADPALAGAFEDLQRHPDARPLPGVLVIRPDAPVFYANAQTVRDGTETAVAASAGQAHTVILELDANDDFDITSTEQLDKLADSLHGQNVGLAVAHLDQPAQRMAQAAGLLDKVGPDRVFATVSSAISWASRPHPARPARALAAPPGRDGDPSNPTTD